MVVGVIEKVMPVAQRELLQIGDFRFVDDVLEKKKE